MTGRFDPGGEEFRRDSPGEPVVSGDADDVVHAVVLAPGHELLARVGGVGADKQPHVRPPASELVGDAGDRVACPHGVTLGYRHLADMDVCDMDIRRFAVDQLLGPDGARASRAHDPRGRGFHDTARRPSLRA